MNKESFTIVLGVHERIITVDKSGYQRFIVENSESGEVFVHLGESYIRFTKQEWRDVAMALFNYRFN